MSPLATFVSLTFSISVAFSAFVALAPGQGTSLAFGFGLAAMFVPAFAVLVVTSVMDAPPPSLHWNRLPVRYLPAAILLMPVVMHAVMLPIAWALWGGLPWAKWLTPGTDGLYHTPADRNWGVLATGGLVGRVALNIVAGLLLNSTLAFFEEVGWRGWMLPRLLERTGQRTAVVVSALVWAAWHAPFALGGIHQLPGIPALLVLMTMQVVIIGAGLVLGWLWLKTESIWLLALAHGAFNNWGQYAFKFMDDGGGSGGAPRDMLILGAGGISLVVVGSLLLALTRGASKSAC